MQRKASGMSEVIGDCDDPTLRTSPMAAVDGAFSNPRDTLHHDVDDSATWECTDTRYEPTSLPVVVSGQLCMVETSEVSTLFSLNAAVRKTLKIEAPSIIYFDINNRKLQTDTILRSAMRELLFPFYGKTSDDGSDASGQAEDTSQVQWRIIQAQMAAVMTTSEANRRKLGDVEDHLEKSATYLQALFRRCSECLDGISALTNGERQMRQTGLQQRTRQFQEMSDQLNNESETRRRETEGLVAVLNEIHSQTNENNHEIAFLQKHQDACAAQLHERFEDMANQGTRRLDDHLTALKNDNLNCLTRQLQVRRGEAQTSVGKTTSWVWDFEQQNAISENPPSDSMSSQASNFEFVSGRHDPARTGQLGLSIPQSQEVNKRMCFASTASIDMDVVNSELDDISPSAAKRRSSLASTIGIHMTGSKCDTVASLASSLDRVFQAMELLRLEQKQAHTQVQNSLVTMGDLGVTVGAEVRELAQQELKLRDEQIRRAHQGMNDQQARFINALEQRLINKIEHRFMQHESVVKGIVKEATNALKPFPTTHELPKAASGPEVQAVASGGRSSSPTRSISCSSLVIPNFSVRYKAPDARLGTPTKARQLSSNRGNKLQSSTVVIGEEKSVERLISSRSSGTLVNACGVSLTAPSSARNPPTSRTGHTGCLTPRTAPAISPPASLISGAAGSLRNDAGRPQSPRPTTYSAVPSSQLSASRMPHSAAMPRRTL